MDSPQVLEATAPQDDRAAIADVIRGWAEASAAKDIDRVMAFFSENFRSDILDSKAQMREYWSLAMKHGLTDEIKVRFDPAEIRIDGDIAITGKVRQQATIGGYSQVMVFVKEKDGVWRIVDSYILG